MLDQKTRTFDYLVIGYILCYFFVNFLFLEGFPFVHSDEAWLSGLTRNMVDKGSFGVTETFFDLKPRYPHGIKILFHMMQMIMLKFFGYQIGSFRLLSLLFGCISLLLFYLLLKVITGRSALPLAGCILLSVDIQFLYAAHFARQEIILTALILLCLLLIVNRKYVLAGVVTGLSIGIHPNSFLIAAMCAVILFPSGFSSLLDRERRRPIFRYTAVVSGFAAVFTGISLYLDRRFFQHYLEYGNSEFEIGAPVWYKLAELPYFIQKLWHQVSGTYYVPDIRAELILFGLVLAGGFFILLRSSSNQSLNEAVALLMKGITGILLGMVMIGRYNQTSIVFLFPLFLALLVVELEWAVSERSAETTDWIGSHRLRWAAGVLMAGLIFGLGSSSFFQIRPWLDKTYDAYLEDISRAVLPEEKVLANLNCDYYFENGKLLDYRNLAYLKENRLTVADYIENNQIEYIILSDEMDFIYSQRPVWNIIYGNPRYMEELRSYTKEHCSLVGSFVNNTYGIRIVPYMNRSDRDFTVEIFKVEDSARKP